MKLIKKINNNFVLALDSSGEQIIVEGKGLGFMKLPCELRDYNAITRAYYDVDHQYLCLIDALPQEVISISNRVCDFLLSRIDAPVNPNLPFILADHISFAIERIQKKTTYSFPMYHDLKHMYPLEYKAACLAVDLVRTELRVVLPEGEKAGIMLNIINAETNLGTVKQEEMVDAWVDQFICIIEAASKGKMRISREGFNYSRFVSHINYMYRRIMGLDEKLETQNVRMYQELVNEYSYDHICVERFSAYLKEKYKIELSTEERLYLILHVNRLCSREMT